MSHLFRFFGQEITSTSWTIDQDELEHLRKVLRLQVGSELEVMNGKGLIAKGQLTELTKDHASVAIISREFIEQTSVRKCLAIGALKPGDLDDILTDLVELGMDEIHVFQQTDTAKYRTGDKPKERWQRLIRSAVKQCKTAWCPVVVVHDSLKYALAALSIHQQKFVLDAAGSDSLLIALQKPATSVAMIVGSERGLNQDELLCCQNAGFQVVRLGDNVLRARTAGVAAAAILGAVCHNATTSA